MAEYNVKQVSNVMTMLFTLFACSLDPNVWLPTEVLYVCMFCMVIKPNIINDPAFIFNNLHRPVNLLVE